MVKRGSTKIKLTAILLLKIVLTSTGTERKIHKLFPSNEIEQEAENVIPTNIANKKGIICFIKDIICGTCNISIGGLLLNLKFPLLNWTNETVVIKQSAASMLTSLGGM